MGSFSGYTAGGTYNWDSDQGVPMSISSSSDSYRSQISSNTQYSVSPHEGTMESSSVYDDSSFNPPYYDQYRSSSSRATGAPSTNHSSYYHSGSNLGARHTPLSLRWEDSWEMWKYYKFEFPARDSKLKDPLFTLPTEFPESAITPRTVYLDRESNPQKGYYPCQFPGTACWKKGSRPAFHRSADRFRHYENVHMEKGGIPCDYSNCARSSDTFGRKDHYRDHLRDFHKEDMPRPKDESKGTWKDERKISPRWYRCTKCLKRIIVKECGWTCSGCKLDCEDDRRKARTKGVDERYDQKSMKVEAETSVELYSACSVCDGHKYHADGRGGWEACKFCAPDSTSAYGIPYSTTGSSSFRDGATEYSSIDYTKQYEPRYYSPS